MFNNEFYPTPFEVISQMIQPIDIKGKIVYEPHGGKADIIKVCKDFGAKEILFTEIEIELAKICATYARKIGTDVFDIRPEQISHVDIIVMNPPFSNSDKHIKHIWDIAPAGCEIVSLINYNTYKNDYSFSRSSLKKIISDYGSCIELGDVFLTSERKTDVNVGLVRLFKPRSENEFEFDNCFELEEEYINVSQGIQKFDEIDAIISTYVYANKNVDSFIEQSNILKEIIKPLDIRGIEFGIYDRYNNLELDKQQYKKRLLRASWEKVFSLLQMDKYITQNVKNELNKFIELQSNVPFTKKNIFKMIYTIVGTHESRMNKMLADVFDKICWYSSKSENRSETWKTNSNYKINKKIILPIRANSKYYDTIDIAYGSESLFNDFTKALCLVFGFDFTQTKDIRCLNGKSFGELLDWNFFAVKIYKKDSIHLEFKDERQWILLNQTIAKLKGDVLPTETDSKESGRERTKTNKIKVYV